MILTVDEEDVTHIDEDSIILDKGDCMLFLRPVRKGFCLHEVPIKGLDKVAPLIFNLGIPVDMKIPDNVSDPEEFAQTVLAIASPDWSAYIIDRHNEYRDDNADLFVALIDIIDTTQFHITGKVGWKIDSLRCHKKDQDPIIGVDNYVYHNISKRIDALGMN